MSYRAFGATVADAATEAGLPLVAGSGPQSMASGPWLTPGLMLGVGIGGGVALLGALTVTAVVYARHRPVRTNRRRRS